MVCGCVPLSLSAALDIFPPWLPLPFVPGIPPEKKKDSGRTETKAKKKKE